ncbi:MAG TPA: acyltransferase [Edaphobacter sp.]|nr:acyltransferase [Edaphobacter sp.]
MSQDALSRTKKNYPLTSVRFFAALFVVLHHSAPAFLDYFRGMSMNVVPKDFFGRILFSVTFSVSFFYLLSGYVLAMVYLRQGKPVDAKRFFAARFARIYPLYLVMLVLDLPEILAPEIQRFGVATGLFKVMKIFTGNVLLLQAWVPERLLRMNSPSWSLCGEAFFYVCFPVLGVALWKLRGARLWMTAIALYVGGQALVWAVRPHLSRQTVLYLPVLHLSTFALGVLLARWQRLRQEREGGEAVRMWQVHTVLGLSIAGVVLSILLLPFFKVTMPYNNGLLAPVLAGFIWAISARTISASTTSARTEGLSRWLCASWLVALGNASYAIYLIHGPLLLLFLYLGWVSAACYPVYLGLCVGLSLLSFYYFETPVRQWLLQRFHTRSLETMEVASIAQ